MCKEGEKMIEIDIKDKDDIKRAIIDIWGNCPNIWDNEDILSEIEKGIEQLREFIAKKKEGK